MGADDLATLATKGMVINHMTKKFLVSAAEALTL